MTMTPDSALRRIAEMIGTGLLLASLWAIILFVVLIFGPIIAEGF